MGRKPIGMATRDTGTTGWFRFGRFLFWATRNAH